MEGTSMNMNINVEGAKCQKKSVMTIGKLPQKGQTLITQYTGN